MKKVFLITVTMSMIMAGSAWANDTLENIKIQNTTANCFEMGKNMAHMEHSSMMGVNSGNSCSGQMTPAMMQMHQKMMVTQTSMKETYGKTFSQMTPSERAAVVRLNSNNGTAPINQILAQQNTDI